MPGTRHAVIFVLGGYAPPRDGAPEDIAPFREALGTGRFDWTICCFGPQEPAAALRAMAEGGHVRQGFENNFLRADGTAAPNTAALIAETAAHAPAAGRTLGAAPHALGIYEDTDR